MLFPAMPPSHEATGANMNITFQGKWTDLIQTLQAAKISGEKYDMPSVGSGSMAFCSTMLTALGKVALASQVPRTEISLVVISHCASSARARLFTPKSTTVPDGFPFGLFAAMAA